MSRSRLDSIYRRMLITRFFEKGWGKPENLQRIFDFRKTISCRRKCYQLVPKHYPVTVTKTDVSSDSTLIEGHFLTPLELHLPGVVPKAARQANFQFIVPNKWKSDDFKPICIQLAGTGDHFFWRRRTFMAKPLLKEENIGSILLENPFYGSRKPRDQVRSNLRNVSDIFVMGGCLILECLVLLHWCENNGYGPLGITGLSMGGHMASLAATNWPKPLALVPCLSWSTASTVFTSGVMSKSINWDMLETQYYSDGRYSERLAKMVTIVDEAYQAGQKFIKNFNESLNELKEDIKNSRDHNFENGITNAVNVGNMGKSYRSKRGGAANNELTCTMKIPSGIPNTSRLTNLMELILPKGKQKAGKIDIMRTNWWEREALQFMRGIMDECTHLKNFSVPYDTSLIIVVCAKDDAYVPREGCSSLEDIWPGVEVRYLDAGHVSAYVLHQKMFRSCIAEAFEKARLVNISRREEGTECHVTFEELYQQYKRTIKFDRP